MTCLCYNIPHLYSTLVWIKTSAKWKCKLHFWPVCILCNSIHKKVFISVKAHPLHHPQQCLKFTTRGPNHLSIDSHASYYKIDCSDLHFAYCLHPVDPYSSALSLHSCLLNSESDYTIQQYSKAPSHSQFLPIKMFESLA